MLDRIYLKRTSRVCRRAPLAALFSLLSLSANGLPAQVRKPPGKSVVEAEAKHWAWQPIRPVAIPRVTNRAWVRTPIDAFVLAKLESRGLTPNAPADRRTLIRRVTFDLVGLPPTPEEVDSFVRSTDSHAYEKLVDRLLGSPRYGERWGRHWLDVVHYGDTHGYDKDKRRDNAWPYRDYVIQALNRDKPYGRFIREQIAGDVLWPDKPDAVIATGFVAAGPWDFVGHEELREGTVEKAKTRLLDRDDMVASTLSTFDSVTVHCARCHDHKFDPIPQRDYYRLQACFAGVERRNRPIPGGPDTTARLKLLARRDAADGKLKQIEARLTEASAADPQIQGLDRKIRAVAAALENAPRSAIGAPSPTNGYHSAVSASQNVTKWVQVDLGKSVPIDQIRVIPARPTDFPDTPGFGFPLRFKVEVSDDPGFAKPVLVTDASATDTPNPGNNAVAMPAQGRHGRHVRMTAYRLWRRTGDYVFALAELQVISGGRNVAAGQTVTALDSIEAGRWGARNLVDGFDSRNQLPDLSDSAVVAAQAERDKLQRELDSLRQERDKRSQDLVPPSDRSERDAAAQEIADIDAAVKRLPPPRMVYALQSREPRPVAILSRGDVEKPLEVVGPGALTCLTGLNSVFASLRPGDEGARRAELAGWIASPKNALTWRSIVNRVWHYHFGKGIVETPNDFGKNGGRPSHPQLLDWLAAAFARENEPGAGIGLGQSLKALHRIIVLSSVYRQSSADRPEYARLDGDNRLLWRMNRQRLEAESVRDSVLMVSGKLDLTMGGAGFELFRFKDDHSPIYDHTAIEKINDPRGWRRSVYRFVVRSVPNPFLESLDCADPNVNTPVRNTTLTALQALALLNDPFMLDQAAHFAERVARFSPDIDQQVRQAVRLAFCREPSSSEKAELSGYARKHGLAATCRLLLNANEFAFVD